MFLNLSGLSSVSLTPTCQAERTFCPFFLLFPFFISQFTKCCCASVVVLDLMPHVWRYRKNSASTSCILLPSSSIPCLFTYSFTLSNHSLSFCKMVCNSSKSNSFSLEIIDLFILTILHYCPVKNGNWSLK